MQCTRQAKREVPWGCTCFQVHVLYATGRWSPQQTVRILPFIQKVAARRGSVNLPAAEHLRGRLVAIAPVSSHLPGRREELISRLTANRRLRSQLACSAGARTGVHNATMGCPVVISMRDLRTVCRLWCCAGAAYHVNVAGAVAGADQAPQAAPDRARGGQQVRAFADSVVRPGCELGRPRRCAPWSVLQLRISCCSRTPAWAPAAVAGTGVRLWSLDPQPLGV